MDFAVIAVVAALTSALTLYSGFGLGTILLPVRRLEKGDDRDPPLQRRGADAGDRRGRRTGVLC